MDYCQKIGEDPKDKRLNLPLLTDRNDRNAGKGKEYTRKEKKKEEKKSNQKYDYKRYFFSNPEKNRDEKGNEVNIRHNVRLKVNRNYIILTFQ